MTSVIVWRPGRTFPVWLSRQVHVQESAQELVECHEALRRKGTNHEWSPSLAQLHHWANDEEALETTAHLREWAWKSMPIWVALEILEDRPLAFGKQVLHMILWPCNKLNITLRSQCQAPVDTMICENNHVCASQNCGHVLCVINARERWSNEVQELAVWDGSFAFLLHLFEQLSIDILVVWIVAACRPGPWSNMIKLRWGVASPNCCIFFLSVTFTVAVITCKCYAAFHSRRTFCIIFSDISLISKCQRLKPWKRKLQTKWQKDSGKPSGKKRPCVEASWWAQP